MEKTFNKNKFFTVVYTKKDGTTNTYILRSGVRRWKTDKGEQAEVKGTGHPTAAGMVKLYSANRKGYRTFIVDNVAEVKQLGVTYSNQILQTI